MNQNCRLDWIRKNQHRALAFLEFSSNNRVNICDTFPGLGLKIKRYFEVSFDYWRDGVWRKNRFHGWDASTENGRYKDCFVFKNNAGQHRLYGFLMHSPHDSRQQLCILAHYAYKKRWNTDKSILKQMLELTLDEDVCEEISRSLRDD